MCALRDSRSISAVSLACQYRLNVTPKRPAPRKLTRRRRGEVGPEVEDEVTEVDIKSRVSVSKADSEDEEFDFDAEEDYDPPPDTTELSQRYYLMACKDLKVRPIRCIYQGLVNDQLRCKGTVLLHNDVKACTIALVNNSNCEKLLFDGNEIGQKPGTYFADVFTKNAYITEIVITWNALGTAGAEAICNALLKNNNVKLLDLSGNQFKEGDAVYFRHLLEENCSIQELYLSHNYFREEGGEEIADGLAQNDFIRVLGLGWNHLRLDGATAIGRCLEKHSNLEVLDLSWNGLYMQGAVNLAVSLSKNQTLKELDISCNRLSEACMAEFLKGLKKNTSIKVLKMGRNHISHNGARLILECIKAAPTIGVEFIDMGDQHVHDDFVKLLKEIQETRPLDVKYGTVWSNDRMPIGQDDQSEDELALLNENPQYVLMEFMRIQKLRLVDLFHQMDKDNSKGISVTEFQEGLLDVHIPMKRKTLKKFVQMCDNNKDGEIDYSELMEANRQYKAEIRKLAQKNIPIETTDIGRIQKLIRKIMLNSRGVPCMEAVEGHRGSIESTFDEPLLSNRKRMSVDVTSNRTIQRRASDGTASLANQRRASTTGNKLIIKS